MAKESSKFGKYFNLPNPGLRTYFDRVRSGQPDEYRTPFSKGESVQSVLSAWDRILKPVRADWPTLYEFENDLRSKVGPMSVMKPLSERMTDIDNYYDLISKDQTTFMPEAVDRTVREWGRGIKSIRNEKDVVAIMKKSTNSGSPFFTKRKLVTNKTIPCYVDPNDGDTLQYLGNKATEWGACAVLGWRGQEGGPSKDDVKQRVVWMFPYAVNIQELRVYQPLIEYAQRYKIVPAWVSMDCVDEEITRLFDTKGKDDLIICTDFSKFDQHFNHSCQDAAKQVLTALLPDGVDARAWLEDVFPIKYNIPLAYDWEKVRFGAHGMASGSGGTNADETLTHRTLQHEAAIKSNAKLNPHSQCLGDDGILSYPGITVDDVMQTYTAHGLDMNPDKQYVSKQDCVYLRRWHHKDYRDDRGICVGVYSTFRALGRLMEQERYYDPDVWSAKMVALRQLSIIENCKYHPYREQFAKFCMKRDKYRLGIDIPGFLENIDSIAQEATDYMPDFLGYTKSLAKDADTGLSNWWIVKYLKSHA
nr:MAG: RNA-dependent RNA polymerase [Porcine picobirnavirus]